MMSLTVDLRKDRLSYLRIFFPLPVPEELIIEVIAVAWSYSMTSEGSAGPQVSVQSHEGGGGEIQEAF